MILPFFFLIADGFPLTPPFHGPLLGADHMLLPVFDAAQ
jgi:hypothetical protein